MREGAAVVVNEKPSIVWLDPGRIRSRFDATYFSAEFLQLDTVFERHEKTTVRPLDELLVTPRRIMYLQTETFDAKDLPNGIPFISGVDVDESAMSVSLEHAKVVERSMANRYPKGILFDGAILIKVKGPNQLAAYVDRVSRLCLVSGSFVFGATRGIDPWYLTAYLSTRFAQAWRTRLRQNITVEFTQYDELARIPVLTPNPVFQHAIGKKVRKAQRLRYLSDKHWANAKSRFEVSSGISLEKSTFDSVAVVDLNDQHYQCISVSPAVSWVPTPDVLAAQYFHPRRVHSQRIASRDRRWQPLSDLAIARTRRERTVVPSIVVGLDQIDSRLGVVALNGLAAEQEQPSDVVYRSGYILFSRLRPYLNRVAIWPEHWNDGTGSAELLVYEAKESIDAHYLFFVLKSFLGLYQVLDVTAGSTLPRVDSEVVESIRIPRQSKEDEQSIGASVRSAHSCWYQSQELIPAAIADVECLIDGTIDEAKLIGEAEEIERWLAQNPSSAEDGGHQHGIEL